MKSKNKEKKERFFSRLNYSFGNEDWSTEKRALQITPQDRVLCITASGDRPLHTLLENCKEVVAIDANPIQNHLCSLKMAAMRHLDYEHYLSFLGAIDGHPKHRRETLKKLHPHMHEEPASFWNTHVKAIEKGILYQGAMEKWVRFLSPMVKALRRSKVDHLFEHDDIEEQKKFIQEKWDTATWKKIFEVVGWTSKNVFRDPGLTKSHTSNPGLYIFERMNASLKRHLAKENLLVSLMFKGKVEKEAFPPYLTEQGFEIIRKRLDRLTLQTGDVISYLEKAPENSFSAYSISDVASYISETDFHRLIRAIHRTAEPGAKFSIREFCSFHQLPNDMKPVFQRDSELEHQLEHDDRCFVYRFIVGKIKK